MAIQRNTLCRDLLESYPSRWRCAVNRGLVPPLHPVSGLLVEGGSASMSVSISPSTSSVLCRRSAFSIVLIMQTRPRVRYWSHAGSRRAETLLLTSLRCNEYLLLFCKYVRQRKPVKFIVNFSSLPIPNIILSSMFMCAKGGIQQALASTHHYITYLPHRNIFPVL